MSKEAMKQMVHELEYVLDCINKDKIPFDGDDFHEALRLGRQAIAEAEQEQGEPVAYINVEERKLEWANKDMSWDTPTVVNLPRIPLYTTIQPAPQGEPVIAGALFDFMGWLTSRKERLVLSSADEASPAVDAIRDFAKMRGLSINDARVQDWNTTPQQRTWVGLTDEEIGMAFRAVFPVGGVVFTNGATEFAQTIERKLKDKNL